MAPRNKKGSLGARLELARNNVSAGVAGTIPVAHSKNKSHSKKVFSRPQTPDVEQPIPEGCICQREAQTFVCIFCKMFCFGRVNESCPIHTNVTYLMDFTCCPYCSGPAEHLHVVDMEYERYFKL
ncbi:uncharacterized protein CG13380-like [Rhagoletis pomonella]|uniref:uncharacterized protein CG13380-like n=1 Tax=Rhagoletis pomonella TaxID=28610 RepID=UPI00177A7CC9|nr:uncharacterized protein CG13380-like [Rhagoletis pomonella]